MGESRLLIDILVQEDTRCGFKDIAEDEIDIAIKYNYDFKESSYFKMGCYECNGYQPNCEKPKQLNFGHLD